MSEMSIPDVARELGYNPEYVRRLVRDRTLDGVKVGRHWLVDSESVAAYKLGGRLGRLKLACEWTSLIGDAHRAPDLERLLRATFKLTDTEVTDLLGIWHRALEAHGVKQRQPMVVPAAAAHGTLAQTAAKVAIEKNVQKAAKQRRAYKPSPLSRQEGDS